TMANARKVAEAENEDAVATDSELDENILLALNHAQTVERMVNLAALIKQKNNEDRLHAVNVISEEKNESSVKNAEKLLDEAIKNAAAMDVQLNPVTRYDSDVVNGIRNV